MKKNNSTKVKLPSKIQVGYQKEKSVSSGQLAFITYKNDKGTLQKKKTFESWRDQGIPAQEFENVPTSGFYLNKKVQGTDDAMWEATEEFFSIFDPRGFEVEVSAKNVVYILQCTQSILGGKLEGEFVYAWTGGSSILLPVNSPEYKTLMKISQLKDRNGYVEQDDLKVGSSYLTVTNETWVYLGCFDEYDYEYESISGRLIPNKKDEMKYYFAKQMSETEPFVIFTVGVIYKQLIACLDEELHVELKDILDELERNPMYSPIDHSKTIHESLSLEHFLNEMTIHGEKDFLASNGKKYKVEVNKFYHDEVSFMGEVKEEQHVGLFGVVRTNKVSQVNTYKGVKYDVNTLEDVYHILNPMVEYVYLKNGNLYNKKY